MMADEAWSQPPSEEFAAWGEKYADVLTCDGDGRRRSTMPIGAELDKNRALRGFFTTWVNIRTLFVI